MSISACEVAKQFATFRPRYDSRFFKGVITPEMMVLPIFKNLDAKFVASDVNVAHTCSALAGSGKVTCVLCVGSEPQMIDGAASGVAMELVVKKEPVWDRPVNLFPRKPVRDSKTAANSHDAIPISVTGTYPNQTITAALDALVKSIGICLTGTLLHILLLASSSEWVRHPARVGALLGAVSLYRR